MKRQKRYALVLFTIVFLGAGGCGLLDKDVADDLTSPAASSSATDLTNIVGGDLASIDRWRAIAALVDHSANVPMRGQFCGGTLILPNWVITAAHCVQDGTSIDVVVGTSSLVATSGYERISVLRQIPHPYYNSWSYDNDIALLQLSSAAAVTPVGGWDTSGLATPGKYGIVAGWGSTDNYGTEYPTELYQVLLPIIPDDICAQKTSSLTSNMFCAAYPAGGKDSCYGDSGGPFMVDGVLTGVVSWGTSGACAMPGEYGVYTKVANYSDWIFSVIQTYSE